jgi:hypothetical protein
MVDSTIYLSRDDDSSKYGIYKSGYSGTSQTPTRILDKDDIRHYIREIISMYPTNPLNGKKLVKVKVEDYSKSSLYDEKMISIDDYNMQLLHSINNVAMIQNAPGLLELVFALNNFDLRCGGTLDLRTNHRAEYPYKIEPSLKTRHSRKNARIKTNEYTNAEDIFTYNTKLSGVVSDAEGNYTVAFKRFVHKFIKKVRRVGCSFTSLYLIVDFYDHKKEEMTGHAMNLIAFPKDNKIILNIYDTNGVIARKSNPGKITTLLIKRMMEVAPDVFEVANRADISCKIGLQHASKDKEGYCVLFALFWLHCLLYITNRSRYGINDKNILLLETCLLEVSNNQLLDLMKSFAMVLVSSYVAETKNQISPQVEELFQLKVKHNAVLHELPHDYDVNIHYPNTYVPTTDEGVVEENDETFDKLRDGHSCNKNDQCYSYNCEKGVCVARDLKFNRKRARFSLRLMKQ